MRHRWRRKRLHQAPELNITAFMNLMVILVPFLLITAVFSRITILELNVPQAASSEQVTAKEAAIDLEVIVRHNRIEVGDRKRGLLSSVKTMTDGSDLAEVSELLQKIKARYPDTADITLLLEADIAYERLVQVMDTLRVAEVKQDGKRTPAELFPVISIGDAPVDRPRTGRWNPL